MTLRAEYRMHHSGLEPFLSAPIWAEDNGSELSVLSAFARLDLDPWQEAGRLAVLPRNDAAADLAATLARLPSPETDTPDHDTLARDLVAFLPERRPSSPPTSPATRDSAGRAGDNRLPLLLLTALIAALGLLYALGWSP